MRKKTITAGIISLCTLLSLLVGQKYWAGLGLGLLLGLTNDWLFSLVLTLLSSRGPSSRLTRVLGWLTVILYPLKQGIFFVALYIIIRAFELDLMAFVLGVVGYQGYRLVLMIFSPERYLESVSGVSTGR